MFTILKEQNNLVLQGFADMRVLQDKIIRNLQLEIKSLLLRNNIVAISSQANNKYKMIDSFIVKL